MKRIFFSLLLLIPLGLKAQFSFTIQGKVGKIDAPSKVYLTYTQYGAQRADSLIMKDGAFTFTGRVDVITMAALVMDYKGVGLRSLNQKSKIDVITLYLVEGTTTVNSPDSLSKAVVAGNKINEEGQKLLALLKPVNSKIIALNTEYETAPTEKKASPEFTAGLQARYNEFVAERNAINKIFIYDNPKSFVSFIALQNFASANPESPELDTLFNSLAPEIQNRKEAAAFRTSLESIRRTAIGAQAIDFAQADPNGKLVKLSSFRGKYVLLDFWASWCGPCRQENPNVVKAFNTYKDKNFTVLGVSLDRENNREAWLKAITTDKLTWTHVSDLKFWNNEVAVKYGIRSIPQNFLINPEGVIIAKNLRGEELQSFLADIFSKEAK